MVHSGFVLSCIKYGDRDAVLKLYSLQAGFQTYFVKGVFNLKSNIRSYLFPFNEIEVSIKKETLGQILSATKIELKESHYDYDSALKTSVLLFCADFLSHILRDENANTWLYLEIQHFLDLIDQAMPDAHLYLLFSILQYNGLLPLLSDGLYLEPEAGLFTNEVSSAVFPLSVSALWKKVIESKVADASICATRDERRILLDALIQYYGFHFANFKVPKSYTVMKELYT